MLIYLSWLVDDVTGAMREPVSADRSLNDRSMYERLFMLSISDGTDPTNELFCKYSKVKFPIEQSTEGMVPVKLSDDGISNGTSYRFMLMMIPITVEIEIIQFF